MSKTTKKWLQTMSNRFQTRADVTDKVNNYLARSNSAVSPHIASKANMYGYQGDPTVSDDLSRPAPSGHHTNPITIIDDSDSEPSQASPAHPVHGRNSSIHFFSSRTKSASPATEFPKFSKLPHNIQMMTWNQAVTNLPGVTRPHFKLVLSIRDAKTAHKLNSKNFEPTDPGITACLNPQPALIDATKEVRTLLRVCRNSRQATKAAPGGQLLWVWYKNRAGDARRAWVPFDFAAGAMSLDIEPFVLSIDEHDAAAETIRPYSESYSSVDMARHMAGLDFAPFIRSLHLLMPCAQDARRLWRDLRRDELSEECLELVKRFVALEKLTVRSNRRGKVPSCSSYPFESTDHFT